MLRKVISIIMIFLSIIILFYDDKQISNAQNKIDVMLKSKKIKRQYDGYIFFPKLKYKNFILSGNEMDVLDKNLVLMMSKKQLMNKDYGNIILAGHNNKYVFSNIYKLFINDEIIISDFDNEYDYIIYEKKYINIKDKSILDNEYNDKILTLITCTNNNQTRLVLKAKFNHIISHN